MRRGSSRRGDEGRAGAGCRVQGQADAGAAETGCSRGRLQRQSAGVDAGIGVQRVIV
jgi:hypothetical protein